MLTRKRVGTHNVCSTPFRCPPIENLTLMDQIIHRANSLLDGCGRIWAVAEVQVEVVKLQPLQRITARLVDVFA